MMLHIAIDSGTTRHYQKRTTDIEYAGMGELEIGFNQLMF
jgi:hypothetical protein